MSTEVSHGRGGAGNINPDTAQYTDGEVVRSGPPGTHEDGPFSTGRGGKGNIGDAGRPSLERRADVDVVPEAAVRPSAEVTDYHTGRGGAGNAHLSMDTKREEKKAEGAAGAAAANGDDVSLADKLKHKIFGMFGKK